jgi:DNA-directed RNA polymerase specialized sigma24 family protein
MAGFVPPGADAPRPAESRAAESRGAEAQLAHLVDYCRALLGRADDAVSVARSVMASEGAPLDDPARLRARLFAVARRRAVALVPVRGAEPRYDVPAAAAGGERFLAVVVSAFESLTYRDREILDLVYRHSIRPADLSAVLEIPAAQAYRRLVNAEEEFISVAAGPASTGGADLEDIAKLPLVALPAPGRAGRLRRRKPNRSVDGSALSRPFARRRSQLAAAAVVPLAAIAWAIMYLAAPGHTNGSHGAARLPSYGASTAGPSPAQTPVSAAAARPTRSTPPAIPVALLLPVPGRSAPQGETLPPPLVNPPPSASSPPPSSTSPSPSSLPPSPSPSSPPLSSPPPSSPPPSSPLPSTPSS